MADMCLDCPMVGKEAEWRSVVEEAIYVYVISISRRRFWYCPSVGRKVS